MRVAFAQPAERDLDAIIAWIARDNPRAAQAVFQAITATVRRLRDFPALGRPGRLSDTREIRVAALPYLIVYQVAGDTLTVVAVFHTSRDLAAALGRRQAELER